MAACMAFYMGKERRARETLYHTVHTTLTTTAEGRPGVRQQRAWPRGARGVACFFPLAMAKCQRPYGRT